MKVKERGKEKVVDRCSRHGSTTKKKKKRRETDSAGSTGRCTKAAQAMQCNVGNRWLIAFGD